MSLKNKHLNLVIIASSLHSLLLMEQGANGLVEVHAPCAACPMCSTITIVPPSTNEIIALWHFVAIAAVLA